MVLKRKVFKKLKEQAHSRKISFLIGARQVGKTTLLKELYVHLSESNKCLFLDLDIFSNYEKVISFENLINSLRLTGYNDDQKDFFYLFLDEFQRYPALTKIMKNVYDNTSNVKIYASGSSSLTIKDQIQESLAGRKIIDEIYPLDFEEFLIFKGKPLLAEKLNNIKKLEGRGLSASLKEYYTLMTEFMVFGGYPEVVLKKTKEEKISVLESIFDLYVKKDLVEYLNIEKILGVKKLIEFLAVNNGKKIKYEEITQITSFHIIELKKYLEILEETYLIKTVRPFYKNKNKELVKIPKIYFIDTGVRNYFINNFNAANIRDDAGFLLESFVLAEILKSGQKNIKFWQDKNMREVDFVLEKEGKTIPIEVKFKKELKSDDFLGLKAFLSMHKQIKNAFLITLDSQKKEKNIQLLQPYLVGREIK
ncbi:ATP-binding protein [archaeon]|nr:ATP-binding protein [archaeon]